MNNIPHPSQWETTSSRGDRMIVRNHGDYLMAKEKVGVNPSRHVFTLFYVPVKPRKSIELGEFGNAEEVHKATTAHEISLDDDLPAVITMVA